MLSRFPSFKPLLLSDKPIITEFTRRFPPYSDFDFPSLWAWNQGDGIRWCLHRGNLVVSLGDYTTGEPLLTMLGDGDVDATADDLLSIAEEQDHLPVLSLVPETTAAQLDTARFRVEADVDHFDYIYEVAEHVVYAGPKLKTHRRQLRSFMRCYGAHEVSSLDCTDAKVRRHVQALWRRWEGQAAQPLAAEAVACQRLLDAADHLNCVATGIYLHGRLVAFDLTTHNDSGCGNSLFAKADVTLKGIYSVLQHEVAKRLLEIGCKRVNFEQDLGIPGLRFAKRSFAPIQYLKKYRVQRSDRALVGE